MQLLNRPFAESLPWCALLLALVLSVGCRTPVPNTLATHDSSRWEKSMAAFEASDRTNPPPKGCILFVGSSSVKLWHSLAEDFPDLPVINRGFGGSQLADSVNFAERIIIPYRPRQVVIYAGSNDINSGKDPALVFGDLVALVKKIQHALPDTQVAVISVAPTHARWKQIDKVQEFNRLAGEYCKRHGLTFINVYPLMLGADGKPRNDIFVKDGLHLNANGYAIWRAAVGPCLRRN